MTTTLLASFPSPAQGVWHLGPVPLRAYALFIIVGIVAALVIGDRRWEARGGERGVIYDIALWAVPFGLIGGRLYHVITDWQTYFGADGAGPMAALRIWDGGLGIWGAVALGGVGAWIGCRRRGIPLPAFGDAIAPGIVLAQAIGRMGNYFNQELYGRATDVPWGMEIFYRRDPSGIIDVHSLNGVSTGDVAAVVHPTFLYELLWNVLVFVALIYVDKRFKIGHGRLFALYVAGYCVGRFGVELMRDDFATLIAGIRINSFTATFVFIGAIVYFILAPKGREDPATLGGDQPDEELVEKTPELAEELAAVAATTGVGAAATVALREDEDADQQSEPESEPEPEVEAAEVEAEPVVVVAESVEPTEADSEESPADEAIVEAQATAGGELVTETDAEAEDADLIDEDHDPVDEDDLESLQGDVAVVGLDGPTSEQQEELTTDEQAEFESDDDEQAESEENAAEGVADVDDTDQPVESEPEVEAEPKADVAPDEAEAEAEVVVASGVVTETDTEAEAADLIDEDHDPVDEEDLEDLTAETPAETDVPASEQQEELTGDEQADAGAEADAAVETGDVDDIDAEEATTGEASPDEEAALADVGLVSAVDPAAEEDGEDSDVAETEPEAEPEPEPEPKATTLPVTPPVYVAPAQPTSRLGRLLRRRKR